jgi:Domain of unknown function (DUF4129)
MGVQIPGAMIADTVAAVFRDPAYHRTALLRRLGIWLLNVLRSILARLEPGRVPSPVFWIIVISVLGAVLLVIGRAAWILVAGSQRVGRRVAGAGADGAQRPDRWGDARRLASRGEYTAAAHELYIGILEAIAGRGEVELHESKTVGDYRRDLSARGSAVLSRFREFASHYELAIYGLGSCDRERYDRLQDLARGIVESVA